MESLQLLVLGYVSYILVGWLALCLPWSQSGDAASWLDHLFTATSAVSTTGLVTVSTSDSYSLVGEIVVLLLIQFGGLGYMTISSFTLLAIAGELSPLRTRVSQAALTLPAGFEVRSFLKVIVGFTIIVEAVGAAALYPSFAAHGAPRPLWQAVFHSVSAFCTAGFGLFNNSLEDYRADGWLNLVICVLSILGAVGFIVVHDIWKSIRRRQYRMTLTSKIILCSTFSICALGTVLFALEEPAVQDLPPGQRWLASLFQVMTASTTVGFNTVPISALSSSSLLLLTAAMIIGASPSGTGGGLKTTTFTSLWAVMVSVVRRREETTFLGRRIPDVRLRAAVANAVFYLLTLAVGAYALSLVETAPLPDQLFECVSALGTVGLSRGVTGGLTPSGKSIIIALMFLGRISPVVMGMAFFRSDATARSRREEDVAI